MLGHLNVQKKGKNSFTGKNRETLQNSLRFNDF